ncbi:hypothetical protein QYF36_007285 [Acer negundo]|nr:hypothetical protein QYF36_007285 [Acer negundo]
MQEVLKKEILRFLYAGIIYPISNSRWVSPIHVAPKTSGVTVVKNDKSELVAQRLQTWWRVCVDYHKLNAIVIAPEDQEKTTFTCPYGTYAFRRMPFGLCNCHIISRKGIEVDRAKVEVIKSLPPPQNVKDIRSFLVHAGFYRRFIRDFSKISRPLCLLLQKNKDFVLSAECLAAFETLKGALTSSPVIKPLVWDFPFEIMCDVSNYAIGAVLGQKIDKDSHVIYYSSWISNDAQLNYSTTEKELLAVIFALKKFRQYLVGSKGYENVVADHLSRLVRESQLDGDEIPLRESFPDEHLWEVQDKEPWVRRGLLGDEGNTSRMSLIFSNTGSTSARKTALNVLRSGFFCVACDRCQRTGNICK